MVRVLAICWRRLGWLAWPALLFCTAMPALAGQASAPQLKPPAAFKATATSSTSVLLKWRDTNAAEKGYLLEVSQADDPFKRLVLLPKNSKSYKYQGLTDGTAYKYRLTAIWKKTRSASRIAKVSTPKSEDPGATKVATPQFSLPGGTFESSAQVAISTATVGATIRFTTDGSDPTDTSLIYSTPLVFTADTTLKARAFKTDQSDSAVAEATYTITTPPNSVAAPVIAPQSGTYVESVAATITCGYSGAEIRYTTDGSDPTHASLLYTAPLDITATTTVKARAFATGLDPSAIASVIFTITPRPVVATPVCSPAAGSYADSVQLTVNCDTPNSVIRYTTDGSDPTPASQYFNPDNGPLVLVNSCEFKARAYKDGYVPSPISSAYYTIYSVSAVAPPIISPSGGNFANAVQITMSCSTGGATIRYTTDGSTPKSTSTIYSGPFTLHNNAILKARGYKLNLTTSNTVVANIDVVSSIARPTLTAQSASASVIHLYWLNTSGNNTYGMVIQRSPDGGKAVPYSTIKIAAAGATSYDDTGLANGQLYYYRARSAEDIDPWSYSSATTHSNDPTNLPASPTGLQVTVVTPPEGGNAHALKFLWSRNAVNDTSYLLEKSDDGENFTLEAELQVATLAATGSQFFTYDSGLPGSVRFFYRVRAKNSVGVSASTAIVSGLTPADNAPPLPGDFAARVADPSHVYLSWTNPSAIDGWRIYLSTGGDPPSLFQTITDPGAGAEPNLIQPFTALNPNTKYDFQVETFRAVGGTPQYSPLTEIVSVTTPPAMGAQFLNKSGWPIISLKINDIEQFTSTFQCIPAGTPQAPASFSADLADGTYTYKAQTGSWHGETPFGLHTYTGSFQVSGGHIADAITFEPPTVQQLMTQFRGTSGIWVGWYVGKSLEYDSSSGTYKEVTKFLPLYFRFYATGPTADSGNCFLTPSSTSPTISLASGTYKLPATGYDGGPISAIDLVLDGVARSAVLSETGGYFTVTLPDYSPYPIYFTADGPVQ